jgi:hypothetical protein
MPKRRIASFCQPTKACGSLGAEGGAPGSNWIYKIIW